MNLFFLCCYAAGSTLSLVSKFFSQSPSTQFLEVTNLGCPIKNHLSKHCTPTAVTNELPSEQHCTPTVIVDDFPLRHSLPSISETNQHLSQPNTSEDNNQNFHVSLDIHSDSLPAYHLVSQSTPPPQVIPARRSSVHHNVPGYLQDYAYTLPKLHTTSLQNMPSNHQTTITSSYPDSEQAIHLTQYDKEPASYEEAS
ncbi:hypothetical protein HAX54_032521 [Datura stramonium]|uniref:Uncharacterized protein n=1 Tax=Datura stramonium TaxID=4076 RepID=A0ABS8VDS1_DATST|nr:hypothetical protein [Datura stramonium]